MDDGKKDSENNQSTEQKGIFSTPELTVNTENLPQNQPAKPAGSAARFNFGRRANRGGNAGSSERVTSAFAQTDVSRQSQRLNEAMLENANAATQSTATGDIQLDVPKKRKKWPWVLASIALGALVAGLIWWFWRDNSDSEDQFWSSFGLYAEYLYFDNADIAQGIDILTIPYGETHLSQIISGADTNETKIAFLTTAQEKLQVSTDALATHLDTSTERVINISELLQLSNIRINALKTFLSTADVGSEDFMRAYLTGGPGVSVDLAKSSYDGFLQSNDSTLIYIAEHKIELAETMDFIYDIYAANNCISANELSSACVEAIVWDEEGQQARLHFGELQNELMITSDTLVNNILNSCQNIINLKNADDITGAEADNEDSSHEEDLEN